MTKNETFKSSDEYKDVETLTNGWLPPEMPARLPRVIELAVSNYEPQFRQMLAASAMPTLSAHASHFRARYLDGEVIGPNQFVGVIGPSGSGKGQCTNLFNILNKETLQANDDAEWQKVRENEKLREQKKNSKDVPQKYIPKLRMVQTCSKSSMIKVQAAQGDNAMLLGQFSEVDQLFKSTTQAYSDISIILRKAWDGDTMSQYYLSESSANVNCRMNMSLLMSGTVKAMLCRMFKDTENGMMQRCVPVVVPETKMTFRPPKHNLLSAQKRQELDDLMMELYKKDQALGDDTLEIELPETTKAIGQWYDSLQELYDNGELSKAEAKLSRRCGQFMMRAAIPLVALEGKETKEIVDYAVWFGQLAFYNLCKIFGSRVAREMAEADTMMPKEVKADGRAVLDGVLAQLADTFSVDDMRKVRAKMGGSMDCKVALHRCVKARKIERIGRGLYRKLSDQLAA